MIHGVARYPPSNLAFLFLFVFFFLCKHGKNLTQMGQNLTDRVVFVKATLKSTKSYPSAALGYLSDQTLLSCALLPGLRRRRISHDEPR